MTLITADELTQIADKESKTRRQLLEEKLLAVAFQFDPKELSKKKVQSLIKTSLARNIIKKFEEYMNKNSKFEAVDFAKALPSELVDGFSEMMMLDSEGLTDEQGQYKDNSGFRPDYREELKLIKLELEIVDLKEDLERSAKKIREYENTQKKVKLQQEEEKFSKLTEKLSKLKGIR